MCNGVLERRYFISSKGISPAAKRLLTKNYFFIFTRSKIVN